VVLLSDCTAGNGIEDKEREEVVEYNSVNKSIKQAMVLLINNLTWLFSRSQLRLVGLLLWPSSFVS
jgi:hypothetical protein